MIIRKKCYNWINMLIDSCLATYSIFGKRRGSSLPTKIEVRKEDNKAYIMITSTMALENMKQIVLKCSCLGTENDLIIWYDNSTNYQVALMKSAERISALELWKSRWNRQPIKCQKTVKRNKKKLGMIKTNNTQHRIQYIIILS